MGYKIMVDVFEGPMDLLLNLIDKAEIDIYDIPINIITEQFIEYIKSMEELNLEVTSDFVLMAATLLEIKSKMLLPKKASDPQKEEEMEEDPRAELIKRIVEYKKYKEAAEELKSYQSIYSKMFFKPKEELTEYIDSDIELEGLNIDMLLKSLNKIISNNKKRARSLEVDLIRREQYTLEECIENIKFKLKSNKKIKFTELLKLESSRSEIVTYFLSLLELIKLKYITIEQEKDFSDLFIIKQ